MMFTLVDGTRLVHSTSDIKEFIRMAFVNKNFRSYVIIDFDSFSCRTTPRDFAKNVTRLLNSGVIYRDLYFALRDTYENRFFSDISEGE